MAVSANMRINSLLGNFEEIEASFNPIKEIRQFIEDNYKMSGGLYISDEPNENGKYEVNSDGDVRAKVGITSLTNNLFEWVEVSGDFSCSSCHSLKTLEGAPRWVKGDFSCSFCEALANLKGSPKRVGGYFSCSWCNSLVSLEGAPKYVGGPFLCYDCGRLISIEDITPKIGGDCVFSGSGSIKITKNIPINIIEKVAKYAMIGRMGMDNFTR